jgi:sodium-dependent dicarboxylate transporter 2/3/5
MSATAPLQSPKPPPSPLKDVSILEDPTAFGARQIVGLILGPAVFLLILLSSPPAGMSVAAWKTTAIGLLMATWWVTEPIPIPITSLLPIVLFPLLGVMKVKDATSPYGDPVIFLFLGGFILALAMERWNLHRRIALSLVKAMGVKPHMLVLGIMTATAFLSMWVSNTATAVMMLPIGMSIIKLVKPDADYGKGKSVDFNFAICLVLGIAYSASIGGVGTLIGTPPNALLAGFMSKSYGVQVGFAQWMMIGVPFVLVGIPASWLLLTRVVFPVRIKEIPGGRETIDREYAKLGPISWAEKWVAVVFLLAAGLWIFRPLLEERIKGLDDGIIAIGAAALLFFIPLKGRKGTYLMDWKAASRLPWDVLLLFGGGLVLAAAVKTSGLAEWLGKSVGGFQISLFAMVVIVTTLIVFLTELTSNTATAAAFLPIVAAIAVGLGENPFLLTVPCAIGASMAYMFPVATPPNAIVYGSGYVTIPQMAKAGVWLNIFFIILIVTSAYTIMLGTFGIDLGVLPEWATKAVAK